MKRTISTSLLLLCLSLSQASTVKAADEDELQGTDLSQSLVNQCDQKKLGDCLLNECATDPEKGVDKKCRRYCEKQAGC